MNLIFKIAWRNLFRHKGKSILIGFILFLGAFIMTLGNSILSGMEKGLQENIMNRFTGDIVLVSTNQKDKSVIAPAMLKAVEPINGYTNIKPVLQKQDYIAKFMPVGRGTSSILNEKGDMNFAFLFGVDFDEYQKMFLSNVSIIEGAAFSSNERGVLITEENRKEGYKLQNFWLTPENFPFKETNLSPEARSNRDGLDIRSNIVFMGFGSDSSSKDIRASVKGIIKYKRLSSMFGNFNLMDIESFRECFGYQTAEDSTVKLDQEKEKLLNMDSENLDNMFGSGMISGADAGSGDYDLKALTKRKQSGQKSIKQIDLENGTYNLVFVKLKNSLGLNNKIKKLNQALKEAKVDAVAISWREAVGQIGDFAAIIKGFLYGFVSLIFFVAIIIIMNTLVMAVIERVTEIGMMRAIGSTRKFILQMIATETGYLSLVFGGLGMVAGGILSTILTSLKIPAKENELLMLFFGGDFFNPLLTLPDVLIGISLLILIIVVAMIYPLRIAYTITPLEAIARE